MTSTTNAPNIICKESEWNIYTSNEQNVIINLDKNDAFISAITSQLSQHFDTTLTNKDVVLYKLPDAEINFKEMCRVCLATTNLKYIFDIIHEGTLISNLLMEFTSIVVQENDIMPKHICDTCISELIYCSRFKEKFLQSQSTLEEIIKYSNIRQGTCWSDNKIQMPFVLHNLENSDFLTKDETEKQEITQTESCGEQESDSNLNEKLNGSIVKEETEVTIQYSEEGSFDPNLLLNDLNMSNFENEEVKDVNKRINCKLPLSCSKCGDDFQTLEELEAHHKEVRHPRKIKKLACQICGKLYARPKLEIHMRTHTKEKPFVCSICSRAFSAKYNLERHSMLHTGERPHKCNICGKGFRRSRNLSEHMCTHTGEKPLLCDVCGRGFSRLSEYRNHMHSHQFTNGKLGKQSKEFQCVVCQKIFSSRNTLKVHMVIHGEKPFLCSECGKGFHVHAGLQSHMKVHTGEKPYSCSECGKRFSQVAALRTHMLIHSGQRPYTCEICLKTFVQKPHLKYHVMMHSGEKPYKCSLCNKCFSTKSARTVHIRTHTGETPYVCDVCGRGFYDSSTLKKHKGRHGRIKTVDETISVKSELV